MTRAAQASDIKAKPRISAEEIDRRREIVRRADHENLLEGIVRGPESDGIFEAFINGEIEVTDMVPRFKELRASRR